MNIPDQLHCLFSAQLTEQDGSYLIEVPEQEFEAGQLQEEEIYRVAVLSTPSETNSTQGDPGLDRQSEQQRPPVEEGETRRVEIEDIGDQGDGITRVERGYVVIVPDAKQGERVRIEITDVQQNVAFASVIERLSYYD
jgi:predicted RNA-binding protein with TRAM domain